MMFVLIYMFLYFSYSCPPRLRERVRAYQVVYFVPVISHSCNMILLPGKNRLIITPAYRRMYRFNILLHLLFFLNTYKCYLASYSILAILQESGNLARKACMHIYSSKAALSGKPTVASV